MSNLFNEYIDEIIKRKTVLFCDRSEASEKERETVSEICSSIGECIKERIRPILAPFEEEVQDVSDI